MPRNDRTGPLGQGSMTGRKLGLCRGNNSESIGFSWLGRRFMNRDKIRYRGKWCFDSVTSEKQTDNTYRDVLEDKFDAIMERLLNIESNLPKKP